MPNKRVAHKIELHVDPAGGTTYTKVANLKKIGYPGSSKEAIDVTCLENDIETGLPAPVLILGDLAMSIFWDEADPDHGLITTMMEGVVDPDPLVQPNWKIVMPFNPSIARGFHGWVKELGEASYEVKTEVLRDFTVHVTTKPVSVAP